MTGSSWISPCRRCARYVSINVFGKGCGLAAPRSASTRAAAIVAPARPSDASPSSCQPARGPESPEPDEQYEVASASSTYRPGQRRCDWWSSTSASRPDSDHHAEAGLARLPVHEIDHLYGVPTPAACALASAHPSRVPRQPASLELPLTPGVDEGVGKQGESAACRSDTGRTCGRSGPEVVRGQWRKFRQYRQQQGGFAGGGAVGFPSLPSHYVGASGRRGPSKDPALTRLG